MTRTGANTVRIAEFDRWSAPLRDSIPQYLAATLAAMLPGHRVEAYPWTSTAAIEVSVAIVQLDGALGGRCTLRAQWTMLTRHPDRKVVYGETTLSEACGSGYTSLVAAQSRLLGGLGADIVAALTSDTPDQRRRERAYVGP